jgi:hypothetical protein
MGADTVDPCTLSFLGPAAVAAASFFILAHELVPGQGMPAQTGDLYENLFLLFATPQIIIGALRKLVTGADRGNGPA